MSWYYADDLTTVVGTGSSYVLSASDVGEQMYFEVSFTDDDEFAESAQYTGAQYVQEAPPVNTPAEFSGLGIVGEFVEGSVLTAEYYQVTDANGWSGVANVS